VTATTEAIVDFREGPHQAQLPRLLVAADEHRPAPARSGGFDALFVCGTHEQASSAVLTLAARLARLHGVTVVDSGPQAGQGGWLRRFVDPLLHWPGA
jgi:hypothetical protein